MESENEILARVRENNRIQVAERRRRGRQSVRAETAEQRELRLQRQRERDRQRRLNETPEQRARRLEQQAEWRRRQNVNPLQNAIRRRSQQNVPARRRGRQSVRAETPEQRELRLQRQRERNRQRFLNEAPEQRARRLERAAEWRQRRANRVPQLPETDAINFDESLVEEHYCGLMNVKCCFCESLNFIDEKPSRDEFFTICCRKGRIKLSRPEYPDFLKDLMSNTLNPDYENFRSNIRSYNSAVSFASMGAKVVDVPGRGPYVFKVQGQTYHVTSHVQPTDGEAPQFAQLYVLDSSTQATDTRQQHPANSGCLGHILYQIDDFFRNNNTIAQSFMMMKQVMAENNIEEQPKINMVFSKNRQMDKRRYNLPNTNEVAMVFVNEDGVPPFKRDIRIYPKNPVDPRKKFVHLGLTSPNLDPMTYALLFPYGEPGWQPYWTCESYENCQTTTVRENVTMLQYKAALTSIRENQFNPIISAGKLTQQWLVDSHLQVEANNLNWVRYNQPKLRAENYKGLSDFVHNLDDQGDRPAGVKVILPSSFEGSPRNMRERCNDAMAIFAAYGAPDLFITFTANPNWTEVTENLRPGEKPIDRPDLLGRVWEIKKEEFIKDLYKKNILGEAVAYAYSIEFQKRGNYHMHLCITYKEQHKFTTIKRIDQIVCAEIPDPATNPRLFEIVTKFMVHGPCGELHPNAPCMDDSKTCSKSFPKSFQNETQMNDNGYPLYRRRQHEPVEINRKKIDNRWIVPYNPYLLLKYNAHINVEVCTSLKAVKYIYKYVFKGYDCATVKITNDEVSNYIDCRYVSAPEAYWRLTEKKMHGQSHNVIRLHVHLPNQQSVCFQPGHEQEALQRAQNKKTSLELWFQLNIEDRSARQYLYIEIPKHYVLKQKWEKRKQRGNAVVPRMFNVSIRDEERFYLRLLLLHVRGATSFQNLRTFDGTVYETFKAAAISRGLLATDTEWDDCLTEAGTYQMPRQLRETFAYILCFHSLSSPLQLWLNHRDNLIMDYRRNDSEEVSSNKVLHDINKVLKQHLLSCEKLGLPVPSGNPPEEINFDVALEAEDGAMRYASLNERQKIAFDMIMQAVNDEDNNNRCFYLDGPGGSGKTYLYCTIMAVLRGKGKVVLPFATTGIASTLLKGGRTVHSGFKLPIPIFENSVSSMRPSSADAEILRKATCLIIDEVSMLTKDGLRVIDLLLREVTAIDKPFGNKVLVVGGDFRQTLPVVPRGTRTDIIETTIKASSLWEHFKTLELSVNMRSHGDHQHNDWLLNVGNGTIPIYADFEDVIEIPSSFITNLDLCDEIFGQDLTRWTVDDLSKRIIVAATNARTLIMNEKIINRLPGESVTYNSADSIVSDDPNDYLNYPVEFLNRQTPSGMPPSKLVLKKGAVIMLLRNLNPKKGLCNGTRLMVQRLGRNCIVAKIISESHKGDECVIPRIDINPSDTILPFKLKRRQLPIIPAYAITINKSQGQSFEFVGIELSKPVFSHGQLYVALSRCKNRGNIKIKMEETSEQGQLQKDHYYTKNVVYNEIFNT